MLVEHAQPLDTQLIVSSVWWDQSWMMSFGFVIWKCFGFPVTYTVTAKRVVDLTKTVCWHCSAEVGHISGKKKNQPCKTICDSITWMHLFNDLITAIMFLHQGISASSLCLPNVNSTSCSHPGIIQCPINGSNNCWRDLHGYRELSV